MKYGIHTLDDFNVKGKIVLCRIDINQPIDRKTGTLKSIARIRACLPTLLELQKHEARLVLLAHQGSDLEYHNFYSTAPHYEVLKETFQGRIHFIDDVCGPAARAAISSLENGHLLLLDNVRFLSEEQTLFELNMKFSTEAQADTLLVRKLAPLADLYVCDAFAAAHRNQPSLCAFEALLPSAMGRLFEQELTVLSELVQNPRSPAVYILGGAKVSDAFLIMRGILESNADCHILTGGLVSNIFLQAAGHEIGQKSLNFINHSGYGGYFAIAKKLYERYPHSIRLPSDVAGISDNMRLEWNADDIPPDACITDIGSKTALHYKKIIQSAGTVFVNGPMGIFENDLSSLGTEIVWRALGESSAHTVIGGGDSITAADQYGVTDAISYVCTGGGALIRFLSGEELPVIAALKRSQKAPQVDGTITNLPLET